MRCLFYLIFVGILLTSCGNMYKKDTKYITSIKNNTNYEIVVKFSENSTIVCHSNQETIIDKYDVEIVKKMSCGVPYIFTQHDAEIIIDDGNKILIKDIYDDNNWICRGKESYDLISFGIYYFSEIKTFFVVNDNNIKDVE